MISFPWGSDDSDTGDEQTGEPAPAESHTDALVVCEFQDGTLVVHTDRVLIDRVTRSRFTNKTIPADEIVGVDFSTGITIGYLQIEQTGVPVDSGGWFSDPVNENTVHFTRADRECAEEARDEILAHASG